MTNTTTLIERNKAFAQHFNADHLMPIPQMRTVIITCGDARVDPAHILGLNLGDAVIIRNNGGRVTPAVIEELAAMSFMVAQMDGDPPQPFEVVLIQHTQCGAERFADPNFQKMLKQHTGVDVSTTAIHNHADTLQADFTSLQKAVNIPDYLLVSGFIYDVKTGELQQQIAPTQLG